MYWRFRFFMLASRIIYSFGLALSPQHLEQEKRATFFCIQSLIHKKKERKEEKMRKRKKRFGNNKKTELRNSEKIAICHAFQSLQQQICVYGFFSYMLDGSPMLLHWTLCSSEMARKKQQHKKKRKKWKNLYRNVGWLGEISLHASRAFSDYVLSLHRHISWGRFAFNIWITRRVVVEREWNERRYIWDIHKAKLWIWC